jgi:hypothetical protein
MDKIISFEQLKSFVKKIRSEKAVTARVGNGSEYFWFRVIEFVRNKEVDFISNSAIFEVDFISDEIYVTKNSLGETYFSVECKVKHEDKFRNKVYETKEFLSITFLEMKSIDFE